MDDDSDAPQVHLGSALLESMKDQPLVADAKRETASIGDDHLLSKCTDLYAVAITDKASALKRGTGAALGIRHNF